MSTGEQPAAKLSSECPDAAKREAIRLLADTDLRFAHCSAKFDMGHF